MLGLLVEFVNVVAVPRDLPIIIFPTYCFISYTLTNVGPLNRMIIP